MVKPNRRWREIVDTPDPWKVIQSHATPPLAALINLLWPTGCRPKGGRTVEARHIHDDLVIFPPDESKGETDSRVIFLTKEAKAISEPRMKDKGVLFKNTRDIPLHQGRPRPSHDPYLEEGRLSVHRLCRSTQQYYQRSGSIGRNVLSLLHLMGHKSTRMVSVMTICYSVLNTFASKQ